MNTKLAPKIPLNTVSEQAFQTSTNEARVEGNQMRAFMRAPRPDMMYYSQDTIDGSREQMLQTFKKNEIALSELNKSTAILSKIKMTNYPHKYMKIDLEASNENYLLN
jgi:hypothetical protein